MEGVSWDVPAALTRVRDGDQTFTDFHQWVPDQEVNDDNIGELMDALMEHPNNLRSIYIKESVITDKGCVKIAEFVKQSSTIDAITITRCPITTKTHFAFADALTTNKSLRVLKLFNEQIEYDEKVAMAFVAALVVNPRPTFEMNSRWTLFFSRRSCGKDYEMLKERAENLNYFPLQQTLLQLID